MLPLPYRMTVIKINEKSLPNTHHLTYFLRWCFAEHSERPVACSFEVPLPLLSLTSAFLNTDGELNKCSERSSLLVTLLLQALKDLA